MKKKIIIDILMLIAMLLEFPRSYMSPLLHEIIGILLIVLLCLHLWENKVYFKNLTKGKYTMNKIIMLIINASFLITMLLSIVFGILSSKSLLAFLNIGNKTISKLHIIFSYISLIIMGLHIGINFNAMFGKLTKKLNNKIVLNIIYIIIVILGILSFLDLDLYEHLIGEYAFHKENGNLIVNTLEYLCVSISFAIMMDKIYSLTKKRLK